MKGNGLTLKKKREETCCGLQTTGDRYVIVLAEKVSHTKEALALLGVQSICEMSHKEREVVSPEQAKLEEYV